jgi:hypothetical protein
MFETLFNPPSADRHRLAPLLREREEFLAHLQRRGNGRDSLRAYASRLNQIVRFLKLKRMRPRETERDQDRGATMGKLSGPA